MALFLWSVNEGKLLTQQPAVFLEDTDWKWPALGSSEQFSNLS